MASNRSATGCRSVDVELPRARGERRRRVLPHRLWEPGRGGGGARGADPPDRRSRRTPGASTAGRASPADGGRTIRARSRNSEFDRWLIGVEGPPDPVTGQRRRFTRTVHGSREQAEVELASLKLAVDGGDVPTATRAKTVRMACDLYLTEARTESQTKRTDQSRRAAESAPPCSQADDRSASCRCPSSTGS